MMNFTVGSILAESITFEAQLYCNVFTAAQLNDLIIKVVIAEPDEALTQDENLAPDYNKTDYQIQRVYNKQPFRN